nr:hypothetical protein [Nostoc sp. ChiSLP03a]MDZ8213279.1 hypothetical protein [Nostoc sp. ChiSLP03a]
MQLHINLVSVTHALSLKIKNLRQGQAIRTYWSGVVINPIGLPNPALIIAEVGARVGYLPEQ